MTVDQDGATITARDAPDSAWLARGEHRAATRTAARTARALAVAAGRTVPAAQSVIVVWGAFPQRVAVSGGVTYVAGEHVHDWLIGQRACLSRTELAALSAANTPSLFGSESSHLLQPDLPEGRQPAGL